MAGESSSVLNRWQLPAFYVLLLVAAVFTFWGIRLAGEAEVASLSSAVNAATAGTSAKKTPEALNSVLLHVLATLTAVIVLGRVLAVGFRLIGQPSVIGEVVAGILLGPSVLGAISPEAMHLLIPDATTDPHGRVVAAMGIVSQIGIVLYMFIVGLELNTTMLVKSAHAAIAISHASIIIPFIAGTGLALWLFPQFAPGATSFTSFSLFLGVAMAITAFPVLARILTDRRIEKTRLGVLALSCAATDDVTAWCLLALVVGVVQSNVTGAIWVIVLTSIYLAVMLLLVRPFAVRLLRRDERHVPRGTIPTLFVAVLASAFVTEAIGIHAVFGAFLIGAIIPHDLPITKSIHDNLHNVVTMLFLPAFFAMSGMNTQIGLMNNLEHWLICAAITAVATIGKFGGTFIAAKMAQISTRDASILGVLMNTRGLMELIVLNIGLSLGVISPVLFAMMVLMAIATTMMTGPALSILWPKEERNAVA